VTQPPDPVEAEATGQQWITASYGGRDYKLPLDADSWPLDLIYASVGVDTDKNVVPNHSVIAVALQRLLGDQWLDFLGSFPQRRHLVPASRTFADTIGFSARPADLAFGALPRLLATLKYWRDAVEATLATMGLDLGDRWRFDEYGQRRLTLRQIHVRLTYAPYDSPLAIAQNGGRATLSAQDLLLMDVFEAITKQRHPSRPLSPSEIEERQVVEKKKNKVTDAVADYYQRHSKTRRQSAIEIAQSNANPRKAAHARQQEAQEQDHD